MGLFGPSKKERHEREYDELRKEQNRLLHQRDDAEDRAIRRSSGVPVCGQPVVLVRRMNEQRDGYVTHIVPADVYRQETHAVQDQIATSQESWEDINRRVRRSMGAPTW